MAVRLVVTITAAPGQGSELAQAYTARCEECMTEPGCEQFEVFQSVLNPNNWPCSSGGPIRGSSGL
jgi:quinol monooxygenase YgiN